jgi:hypothetical protein
MLSNDDDEEGEYPPQLEVIICPAEQIVAIVGPVQQI